MTNTTRNLLAAGTAAALLATSAGVAFAATTATNSDGSTTTTYDDGRSLTTHANGAVTTTYSDGSTYTVAADGTVSTTGATTGINGNGMTGTTATNDTTAVTPQPTSNQVSVENGIYTGWTATGALAPWDGYETITPTFYQAPSTQMQDLTRQTDSARWAGDAKRVRALQADIDTLHQQEVAERRAALDNAVNSGYDAWYTYATNQGATSSDLGHITADNFGRYAELYEARRTVANLEAELGINTSMTSNGGRGLDVTPETNAYNGYWYNY